jgi:hypothetical protein
MEAPSTTGRLKSTLNSSIFRNKWRHCQSRTSAMSAPDGNIVDTVSSGSTVCQVNDDNFSDTMQAEHLTRPTPSHRHKPLWARLSPRMVPASTRGRFRLFARDSGHTSNAQQGSFSVPRSYCHNECKPLTLSRPLDKNSAVSFKRMTCERYTVNSSPL